ncbi:hypothetical protein KY330_05540 [Candidatus Woesearchaeota archaeon]|nr:hypothetical protein [Candidatus Woesearchaeota archaeon]
MKKITTGDDSVTFYNEDYEEAYHSKSGAKQEAVEKFVRPCGIKALAESGCVKVLDVCFGLGYNTAALIDEIWNFNKDCEIIVLGLENDNAIIERINKIDADFDSFSLIKELSKKLKYDNGKLSITLILGDAKKTISELNDDYFDIVFLDPFSPKKCPELWEKEFLSSISKKLKKHGILTTYSCARVVRENLKYAGFEISDGPCVGRRSPSTIAVKK